MLDNILKELQEELKYDCSEKSPIVGFSFSVTLYDGIYNLTVGCKNSKTYSCLWKNGKRDTKLVEVKR